MSHRRIAAILNANDGEKYYIHDNIEKFSFGSSPSCNVVINGPTISAVHCFIMKIHGTYSLFDHQSAYGTFLNCEKLCRGGYGIILVAGDLIGFLESNRIQYIFKFFWKFEDSTDDSLGLSPYLINNSIDNKITRMLNMYKASLIEFYNHLKDVSIDDESVVKCLQDEFNNINRHYLNYVDAFARKLQQNSRDVKEIKDHIFNILQNQLECSICNEVLMQTVTINCGHSFCELCILRWYFRNNACPICRTTTTLLTYSLALDQLISTFYGIMGLAAKQKRDSVLEERATCLTSHPVDMCIKKLWSTGRRRGPRTIRPFDVFEGIQLDNIRRLTVDHRGMPNATGNGMRPAHGNPIVTGPRNGNIHPVAPDNYASANFIELQNGIRPVPDNSRAPNMVGFGNGIQPVPDNSRAPNMVGFGNGIQPVPDNSRVPDMAELINELNSVSGDNYVFPNVAELVNSIRQAADSYETPMIGEVLNDNQPAAPLQPLERDFTEFMDTYLRD